MPWVDKGRSKEILLGINLKLNKTFVLMETLSIKMKSFISNVNHSHIRGSRNVRDNHSSVESERRTMIKIARARDTGRSIT